MFIESTDYPSTIHAEILTAITRSDPTVIADCEDKAIDQVKGYLSARYDIDAIFNATGTSRSKTILQYTLDIAIYRMHIAHNPVKITEARVALYEQALADLSKIQAGKINPPGLPVLMPQDVHGQLLFNSNTKRNNHF